MNQVTSNGIYAQSLLCLASLATTISDAAQGNMETVIKLTQN